MANDYYRTKDGRADYHFSFERQPEGSWRAYILWQPSYSPRDARDHITHRLHDGHRCYVCWSELLWSEEEARKIAAFWADLTQNYIRTGRTIDEQARDMQRRGWWDRIRAYAGI